MKGLLNAKYKILIIISLVIVAAGMFVLGFLGFNQTPDYSNSYEIYVEVEQNANGSGEVVNKATVAYFEKNGIKFADYATQTLDDGKAYVYKLASVDNVNKEVLLANIESALDDASFAALNAEVEIYQAHNPVDGNILYTLLALGIAAVAIFVYALIAEKLASGVATLCSSLISVLTFIALTAITRTPAAPMLFVFASLAMVLGGGLAVAMANRFKEITKLVGNEKLTSAEVAERGAKSSFARLLIALIAMVVAGLVFVVIGLVSAKYFVYFGIQLIITAVASVFAAYTFTPLIWAAIKKTGK